jgi:hypothetical protein
MNYKCYGIKVFLIAAVLLAGCKTLEYKDPDSDAILRYTSAFTSATDVQILFASSDKIVSVSIGSTQNDQVIKQVSDLVKAQNIGDDK